MQKEGEKLVKKQENSNRVTARLVTVAEAKKKKKKKHVLAGLRDSGYEWFLEGCASSTLFFL